MSVNDKIKTVGDISLIGQGEALPANGKPGQVPALGQDGKLKWADAQDGGNSIVSFSIGYDDPRAA